MATKDEGLLNVNIDRPQSGLVTDPNPSDQQKGTTRTVWNGITKTRDGNKNFSTNEESNAIAGAITAGYIQLGKCYMNNGRIAILSVKQDESSSEIGIIDKYANYTAVVNEPELGFKLNSQIDIRYRQRRGCEDVIYFTDYNSSIKFFNYTKLRDFYSQEYLAFLNGGSGTFTGDIWDVSAFNLFPSYQVPCFEKVEVTTGGSIVPGTVNFSIRYLDDDQNPTNWIYASQLVSIYQADNTGDPVNITGSSNSLVDTISGIPNTNKSIKITLGNLDHRFKYYQIAVIQATNSNGQPTSALSSPVFPIGATEYIFNGNTEGYATMALSDLLQGKTDIEIAEHIEQLENKLLLGKVAGKQVAYCTFQQYASKIASNYVIREANNADATSDGTADDPNTYWDSQGYMGDEVYAWAIVYVFNDGLETPGYHIPGRSPGQYVNIDTGVTIDTDDQDIIETWSPDLSPWFTTASDYNSLPDGQKLQKWQVYDTSVLYSAGGVNNSYGAMSYHQNQASTYTKLDDCSEGNSFWGVDACGNDLEGTPVRHHRFPSRFKEVHVRGGSTSTGTTGLYVDVTLIDGQTYPGSDQTIIVAYEINGTPFTYTLTITSDALPIQRLLIDTSDGDFDTITIVSVTGTVDATVFDYNVYRDEATLGQQLTGNIVRNLGIQFSNIEYPDPRIVGHYFVRGPRDLQNRTILDKGFCGNMRMKVVNGINYTGFSYFNGDSNSPTNDNWLFTPRFCFNKEVLDGDFISSENEFINTDTFTGTHKYDGTGSFFKDQDTVIEYRQSSYNGVETTRGGHNYKIDKNLIMDGVSKNTTFEGINTPVYNLSWSNRVQVVHTDTLFPRPTTNLPYVALKSIRDVHPVLSQITYQRTHNCMLTPQGSNVVFGGDTFISRWDISNSLYRTQAKGVLSTLLSIIIIVAAVVVTIGTAGATAPLIAAAITAAGVIGVEAAIVITAVLAGLIGITGQAIQLITGEINGDLENLTFDRVLADATGRGWTLHAYVAYANDTVVGMFVESEVNVNMRQTENSICGGYFIPNQAASDYFRDRWMYYDQTHSAYLPKGYCCPETYHYNKDYSRQNLQSAYFPLPDTYDCCSNCLETHPNRVHYSLESFQEELTDNYRQFLPNNYVDIEAEHGGLTGLTKRQNNLFLMTSEGLWYLPQSQEERSTGDLVTYIGTGAFFSIPPKKMTDNLIGSGGTQHKWACINLDEGLIIVNEIEGKISLFDGQKFNNLSAIGNERWFKNHLKDFFAYQFKQLIGIDFPNINNHASPYGVGIHVAYDEFYNRVIFTKRDFMILPAYIAGFQVVTSSGGILPGSIAPGVLIFDLSVNKFIITGTNSSTYTVVGFDSSAYFENKSWTFSFDLDDKTWTSWHSYLPNFYMFTHDTLYSMTDTSNSIWKHNIAGSYGIFYGKQYPYILEVALSDNPTETRYWEDASLQTLARQFDPVNMDYFDQRFITFNKLTAYNDRQSTGELTLIPKDLGSQQTWLQDQVTSKAPGSIFITRKEEDWNLNELRDYRTDYISTLFKKDWLSLKGTYPIDKVIDTTKIDYNKDWVQLESLRDKYIILRFKFDNFTNIQLITKYIEDTSGISMR